MEGSVIAGQMLPEGQPGSWIDWTDGREVGETRTKGCEEVTESPEAATVYCPGCSA